MIIGFGVILIAILFIIFYIFFVIGLTIFLGVRNFYRIFSPKFESKIKPIWDCKYDDDPVYCKCPMFTDEEYDEYLEAVKQEKREWEDIHVIKKEQ